MPIDRRRAATDRRRIVRVVRVVRGRMGFVLECDPASTTAADATSWRSPRTAPRSAAGDLDPRRCTRYGLKPEPATSDGVRAALELREGEIARRDARDRRARRHRAARAARAPGAVRRDRARTGSDWLARSALPRPLARDGQPLGDHAQADDLRAHRRAGGRAHRRACPSSSAASATGTTATRGCATARSRSPRCSAWASPRRPRRFIRWLGDRDPGAARATCGGPLQIMYRVDGSPDLDEDELDHLDGYRGSRPVRIGNGAADQFQLDIYGEMMDALARADDAGLLLGPRHLDGAARHHRLALRQLGPADEAGIWETRGGAQDFIYGRLMAWVAFDRAIRLATRTRPPGRPAALDHRARPRSTGRSWSVAATRTRGVRPALRLATCSTRRCC